MNQSFARVTREMVSEEQLDACSRILDLTRKEVFYQVKSATTARATCSPVPARQAGRTITAGIDAPPWSLSENTSA